MMVYDLLTPDEIQDLYRDVQKLMSALDEIETPTDPDTSVRALSELTDALESNYATNIRRLLKKAQIRQPF